MRQIQGSIGVCANSLGGEWHQQQARVWVWPLESAHTDQGQRLSRTYMCH